MATIIVRDGGLVSWNTTQSCHYYLLSSESVKWYQDYLLPDGAPI